MSLRTRYWCRHGLVVTVDGPQGPRTTTVEKPYARVASRKGAEVVLPDVKIASRGLYFHATDVGVFGLGFFHSEMSEEPWRGWVKPDEPIPFGPYQVSVRLADSPGVMAEGGFYPPELDSKGTAAEPYPVIAIAFGENESARRHLRRLLTVVGRVRPSTLPILSHDLSASHLVLYWNAGTLWAIDLLSRMGTFIEGLPIECAELPLGCSLTAGEVRLTFASLFSSRQGKSADSPGESQLGEPNPPEGLSRQPVDAKGGETLLEPRRAVAESGAADPKAPELESERESLRRRQETLTRQQQQREAEWRERTAELAERQANLAAEQQRQRLALEKERRALQAQFAEWTASMERSRTELTRQQKDFQKQQDEWMSRQSQLEAELQRRTEELTRLRTTLEAEEERLSRQREAFESQRAAWDAEERRWREGVHRDEQSLRELQADRARMEDRLQEQRTLVERLRVEVQSQETELAAVSASSVDRQSPSVAAAAETEPAAPASAHVSPNEQSVTPGRPREPSAGGEVDASYDEVLDRLMLVSRRRSSWFYRFREGCGDLWRRAISYRPWRRARQSPDLSSPADDQC